MISKDLEQAGEASCSCSSPRLIIEKIALEEQTGVPALKTFLWQVRERFWALQG